MRRTETVRRIATWGVLAAALAGAILFVVLRATTPSDGARVAFYGNGWSDLGVTIDPIDAPAAGLQAGDLVTAVAGRSVDAWLGATLDGSVPRPVGGEPIAYDLVRAGAPVRATVTWTPPAIGATLLAGWSVLLFSVAVAAVAAFVFARRPDEPAALALVLAACGAAGSSVPWFLGTTVSDIVDAGPFLFHTLLTGPVYMLLWPAGVHLALTFPRPAPAVTRHPWLIPAIYAACLGGYGLALAVGRATTTTALAWVGTWPIAQVVVVVPALAAGLVIVVRTYRRTTDPAGRASIRWATLGVVVAATIGLFGYMLPELIVQRPLLPESWIGLTALPIPLGIAAGILFDRLFDIDVVVRRTVVYGGLTVGVVACYVAVASAITAVVGSEHGFGVSLFATGVAALVALPLRDGLQRAASRYLYGERDEPWRAMRRLGQRLELAAEPERVFPTIVDTVADALRLPYVGLALVATDGRLDVVAEHGRRQSDLVIVPIVDGAARVGSLDLGIRAGERGFRSDELELVDDLARQGAVAIRAVRLRADLARSHERLLLAREEERRRLRHDLHDGLGPSLAAIGLRAEASAELLSTDPDAARHLLDELGADVQTALLDVRRLVDGLRPPALDELGLIGAIGQQATRLEGPTSAGPGPTITVVGTPDPLPDLPAAVEVAAYRIAIEAVTNAVRHASARTCRVRVSATDELRVEVVDDGRGLAAGQTPGTGLESIEARVTELGGSLRIDRPRGGGTRLVASLPIGGGPPRLESRSTGPGRRRAHDGAARPDPARDRGRPPVVPLGTASAPRDRRRHRRDRRGGRRRRGGHLGRAAAARRRPDGRVDARRRRDRGDRTHRRGLAPHRGRRADHGRWRRLGGPSAPRRRSRATSSRAPNAPNCSAPSSGRGRRRGPRARRRPPVAGLPLGRHDGGGRRVPRADRPGAGDPGPGRARAVERRDHEPTGPARKTVRNHISNIFAKLGVRDRAEAIVRAREAGLGMEGGRPS